MLTAERLDQALSNDGQHLAKGMYHDVATPVAAIRMLAELAASEEGIPARVEQRLSQIVDETHRITEILTHVLGRTLKQQAQVHPVLTEVVASSRLVHGSPITADFEPALVNADSVSIRRLLSNLIDNACRVSAPSGSVQVRLRALDSGAILEIADSGPGPGPWTEALIGPQVRSSGGMGLSIIRSIVEECQGTITVGRDACLGGSNVVVTFLPVHEYAPHRPPTELAPG